MRLWKAHVNNKWKVFLWKVHNNALPVGKEFQVRNMDGDHSCMWCGMATRSLEHLLKNCVISQHVWAAGLLGIRTEGQTMLSVSEWLTNWFHFIGKDRDKAGEPKSGLLHSTL